MDIRDWHRLIFNEIPVYVLPEGPDWILPNPGGDQLIQRLMNAPPTTGDNCDILSHARDRQFYNELIPPLGQDRYPGRGALLKLSRLKECWFHITDKCNLACRHCMFSCSPADTATMALEDFTCFFLQAFDLGARTFFLTGGEPMVHPDFKEICTRVLDRSPDTCLVILTNGLLIDAFLPFLNTLPQERIHFQISLDGEKTTHDWIRGKGTHERLLKGLGGLTAINRQVSLAMAVSRDNLDEMPGLVDVAARYAISNIHYLWMFARGNSEQNRRIPSREVFIRLKAAHEKAVKQGVSIDNIDTIERQVFSPRGTKYDLGTAGWESLAIGPGGNVYPTPALVREPKALCGNSHDGLGKVWKGSSLLSQIRGLSIVVEPSLTDDPLKFLTGGGDLDHSFYHSGLFAGHDPYMNLYGHIALWLITRSPKGQGTDIPWPCVCMRMGDRLLNCDDTHGQVALTHSNCVLSLGSLTGSVSGFYAMAAENTNQDIVNPVCYPEEEISHVPPTARIRSYGCGSPVLDAGVSPGETLVDLGSGSGMECFIAARKVGRKGRVFGIDMTDSMLALAEKSLGPVETALGYRNVQFKKALLEDLGLPDASTDIVISNCVINLSPDKHRTFGEIFRVLKPGGRLVISDIVTDTPPESAILNDPLLRGECIAGALTLTRLMALLEIAGFENIRIFKRFFYRQVMGHCFYSVTYQAYKPGRQEETEDPKEIIYPGPFAAVMTDKGEVLLRGEKKKMAWQATADDPVFILDANGNAANIEAENSCACYLPPEAESDSIAVVAPDFSGKKRTGCMECGKPLQYFSENKSLACSHCGLVKSANAMCEAGHFICDTCHSKDALTIVTDICVNTPETDMIKILNTIRNHPAMPLHGPEYHFAVPGAIVAAYKNAGGSATREKICAAIERGKAIPGGSCGFWGGCGAALGVGIAFGIILESSPIAAGPRQMVQQVAGKIILELSRVEASRCCQREAWTAMLIARDLSETLLPVALRVDDTLVCTQMGQNKECPGGTCRFFKKAQGGLKLIL